MQSSSKLNGVCQICRKEKFISDLMPALSVRQSIIDLIKAKGYNWDNQGFICLDDLNKYRNVYIQKILQDESGNVSSVEKEVLDSIADKDIFI